MAQVIIYNQINPETGEVTWPAEVRPTQEALEKYGIMAIAIKDVPQGRPFKIVDESELPAEPQETWTVDDADLTDGIGGQSNEFD